jgi:hypothetical protein
MVRRVVWVESGWMPIGLDDILFGIQISMFWRYLEMLRQADFEM